MTTVIIYSSIPLVKVDKLPSAVEYKAMIEQRYGGEQVVEESLTNYQYVRFTIINCSHRYNIAMHTQGLVGTDP